MRNLIILAVILLSCWSLQSTADEKPQPIVVNKAFKFRELIQIIDDCIFAQAQSMLNQAALDGRTATIVSVRKPYEFEKDSSVYESVSRNDDGLEKIVPQTRYFKSVWKGCVADYNEIGFGRDSGNLRFETSQGRTPNGEDCGGYTYADLSTPNGAMPTVVYDPTDRPKIYNNVGEEQYLVEVVAKVQILPGRQPTSPIRLIHGTMGTPTNVYFDPAVYISCLIKKMKP